MLNKSLIVVPKSGKDYTHMLYVQSFIFISTATELRYGYDNGSRVPSMGSITPTVLSISGNVVSITA